MDSSYNLAIHLAAFIRSVDPIEEVFEIITPAPLEYLLENHLYTFVFRPGFELPNSLIIGEHDSLRNVPYSSPISKFAGPTPNIRRVRSNLKRNWTCPN